MRRWKFFNHRESIDGKGERGKFRKQRSENSSTIRRIAASYDSRSFRFKGGEEGNLSEPRVRLFISRKPVTSGN